MGTQIIRKKKVILFLMMMLFILAMSLLCTEKVNAATYWESEPNDYAGYATQVSAISGTHIMGDVCDDDVDFYVFTIKNGCEIKVKMNYYVTDDDLWYGGGCDFDVDFYSSDDFDHVYKGVGAWYNSNLGYVYENRTVYLSAGTYYMKVYANHNSNSSQYDINFITTAYETKIKEPNDFLGQAMILKNGTAYKGLLASNDEDVDFFKTPGTGYYYVTIKNNLQDPGSQYINDDVNVDIYDGEGNLKYIISGNVSRLYADRTYKTTKLIYIGNLNTYFKISAPYSDGKYIFSLTKKPAKVTYPDAVKYGAKGIKIKWKKMSNVTGYKIYRATKKNSGYKLIKTIKNKNTNYYIDKNKIKGKTYYYKIRAYKYVNNYSCLGYMSRVESVKR